MHTLVQRALIAVAATLTAVVTPAMAEAQQQRQATTPAWFEDHWIDLAVSWEGAGACEVGEEIIVCFRNESELNAFDSRGDAHATESAPSVSVTALANCASSVKLYNGISYTGTMLSFVQRGVAINLSAYGFDNATTSYKIGGCDADFYSGPSQSGSVYPGNTAAFAQSASMLTGWNNTISSIYIY